MLLFFLMLLAYIQSIMTGRRLEFFRLELENTRLQLSQTNDDLDVSRLDLDAARLDLNQIRTSLEDTRWILMETEDEIALKAEALKNLEDEIDRSRDAIELGRLQLALSQMEIEAQQDIIDKSNLELGELRVRLSEIAVFRLSILEKVRSSIESAIGKYTEAGEERVAIGPNANIIINETLLFDYASAAVKDDAKQLLDSLAIAFETLLDNQETRLYIDYISVEGHTDAIGAADYNRGLSAERAVSVVNYIMQSNPALEEKYASYFGIGGFSKFRPLAGGDDPDSMAKNRRIEIAVVIKDGSIKDMIDEYLNEAGR